MKGPDLKALSLLGAIVVAVTAMVAFLFQPSLEVVIQTILPSALAKTLYATAIATAINIGLVLIFYKPNPNTVQLRSRPYYCIQPGLEEMLYRFNVVLVMKHFDIESLAIVIVVGIIQAYLFAVFHNVKAFPKVLISSFVYFISAWYFGMIPAIIAHSAGNLLLREIIFRKQGTDGRND